MMANAKTSGNIAKSHFGKKVAKVEAPNASASGHCADNDDDDDDDDDDDRFVSLFLRRDHESRPTDSL